MYTVRLNFNKVGLSIYFSQLDLQRVMARALRISGLPVWFSQGFNPHIYMTFTLPLSLGHESVCESVDFRLTKEMPYDEVKKALENTLPSGIEVVSVTDVSYDARSIAFAKYSLTIFGNPDEIKTAINTYNMKNEVLMEKKSKKKINTVNIKEFIKDIKIENENENSVTISGVFSAGVIMNLNPNLFLNYLESISNVKTFQTKVLREELLDKDMKILQKNTCNFN